MFIAWMFIAWMFIAGMFIAGMFIAGMFIARIWAWRVLVGPLGGGLGDGDEVERPVVGGFLDAGAAGEAGGDDVGGLGGEDAAHVAQAGEGAGFLGVFGFGGQEAEAAQRVPE
jgi:hypothetical protein